MTENREWLKNIKWFKSSDTHVAGGSGKPNVVIGIGILSVVVRSSKREISDFDILNVRLVENFDVILIKTQDLHRVFGFKIDIYTIKILNENSRVVAEIKGDSSKIS
jgi:predicted nucleotidyltransferase